MIAASSWLSIIKFDCDHFELTFVTDQEIPVASILEELERNPKMATLKPPYHNCPLEFEGIRSIAEATLSPKFELIYNLGGEKKYSEEAYISRIPFIERSY